MKALLKAIVPSTSQIIPFPFREDLSYLLMSHLKNFYFLVLNLVTHRMKRISYNYYKMDT